jgi:hypothetical protein
MSDQKKPLRGDDGRVLEPKEGVVLDREGNTVFEPESVGAQGPFAGTGARVRVFRLGWPMGLLLAVLLPVLLVGGFVFFAVFAVALTAIWIILNIINRLRRAFFSR